MKKGKERGFFEDSVLGRLEYFVVFFGIYYFVLNLKYCRFLIIGRGGKGVSLDWVNNVERVIKKVICFLKSLEESN